MADSVRRRIEEAAAAEEERAAVTAEASETSAEADLARYRQIVAALGAAGRTEVAIEVLGVVSFVGRFTAEDDFTLAEYSSGTNDESTSQKLWQVVERTRGWHLADVLHHEVDTDNRFPQAPSLVVAVDGRSWTNFVESCGVGAIYGVIGPNDVMAGTSTAIEDLLGAAAALAPESYASDGTVLNVRRVVTELEQKL